MVAGRHMSEIPKVVPSASTPNTPPADATARPMESGGTGFVTAGHAILFQDDEAHRCDVCASPLEDEAPGDDDETLQ